MRVLLILEVTSVEFPKGKQVVTTVEPESSTVNNINYRLTLGVANLMSQLKETLTEKDNDTSYLLLKRLHGIVASEEGLPVNDTLWHSISSKHPFDFGLTLYYKAEE